MNLDNWKLRINAMSEKELSIELKKLEQGQYDNEFEEGGYDSFDAICSYAEDKLKNLSNI